MRGQAETWALPAHWVLVAAVLLIACAEVAGGAMVQFKVPLARWVRATMLARPEVHGLVGVRDVDEQILDEALVKFDAGLRLFHLHGEGMGVVILVTTMVASTVVRVPARRRFLVGLLTVGGALYPFGYLVWSAAIPFYGVEPAKRLAEWLVWIPFGGSATLGAWLLSGALALRLVGR
jgi:hypothetical protein